MDVFITLLLILFLFALLASGLWIGLALMGVAWIGMELFTARPVGDAMAVTVWGSLSSRIVRLTIEGSAPNWFTVNPYVA